MHFSSEAQRDGAAWGVTDVELEGELAGGAPPSGGAARVGGAAAVGGGATGAEAEGAAAGSGRSAGGAVVPQLIEPAMAASPTHPCRARSSDVRHERIMVRGYATSGDSCKVTLRGSDDAAVHTRLGNTPT